MSSSDNGGDCSGSGGRSPLRGSPVRIQLYNGHEVDADDWYVFDPVYGVIPVTCRDLWNKAGREMEVRRELSIDRGKDRVLPPIRYTHDRRK